MKSKECVCGSFSNPTNKTNQRRKKKETKKESEVKITTIMRTPDIKV